MGDAADRWRAAAEDPSRIWRRIERWKSIAKALRSRLAQNRKLKAELEARDNKPVDNAEAIRARLLQPFLGSEAETLGATKYQLRDGEEWLSTCQGPLWLDDSQYILMKAEQHDDATD